MNITGLLQRIQMGDDDAGESLYAVAAERLKRISQALMQRERPTAGFQPSDLVQEAYVQKSSRLHRSHLAGADDFFALMQLGMKQILIDRARRKATVKRTQPPAYGVYATAPDLRIADLGRHLEKLKSLDSNAYLVLRLRNDFGLGWDEIAKRVKQKPWEVRRDFSFAVEWLREQMS